MKTRRLYKFYPLCSALRNLKEGRLKVSTLSDINDPFEWNSFRLSSKTDREIWDRTRAEIWKDKGIISFSESWRNPVIWAHYADKHRGLCLGFDVSQDISFKVNYLSIRENIPPLSDIVSAQNFEILERAATTKYRHWKYEREWRIFPKLGDPDPKTGLFFEPFSERMKLKEIIIGAECHTASEALKQIVPTEVRITTARLAFRSFSVVQQKNKRLQK